MAQDVQDALCNARHLVIEAGTGVGKSFAYLIPAIYHAVENDKKIIISTYTIALQEQLIFKDIPFIKQALPFEFNATLVKGRSNYLSLRRLNQALLHKDDLFDNKASFEELNDLLRWSKITTDGSISTMDRHPSHAIWDNVVSDADNCMGKKCLYFKDCFFYRHRGKMQKADVLIINHHLFFTHLGLKCAGRPLLPEYDAVIFDEAHNLERVATEYMGIQISDRGMRYLLNQIYNPKRRRGFAMRFNTEELKYLTAKTHKSAEIFFKQAREWLANNDTKRIKTIGFVQDILTPCLKEMLDCLRHQIKYVQNQEEETEIHSYIKKIRHLKNNIKRTLAQEFEDSVYWVQSDRKRSGLTTINVSPVDVGPLLNQMLFSKPQPIIMTSATLSVAGNFDYFKRRIGLMDGCETILNSPFDYKKQVRLYICKNMPDPVNERYLKALVKYIEYYLAKSAGGAFVLFTSYKTMDEVYSMMEPIFDNAGIKSFKQGNGMPILKMVNDFKRNRNSVLFGTDSLWQGIDIPGDALRGIIITKLPFSVPDHPIIESRIEKLKQQGFDPFVEYSVPEAVLKLKQGFGRLIRHSNDSGIVAILDSRIITRSYGKYFLKALPECEMIIE